MAKKLVKGDKMAKEGNSIQSVDRAIAIIKAFEKSEELGVTEISKMTGLHKSTAFNLITTLEKSGILTKSVHSGKYLLGMELFRLGTMVNSSLRNMCRPYLEKLVDTYSETVNLVARNDQLIIYIEKVESPHSMRISTKEGQRLPLHVTAAGKAIISTLPEEEIEEIMNCTTYAKYTIHSVLSREELMIQIQLAKENGYAEDIQELENELTCVAAPIRDFKGIANYAISVSGPSSRMTKEVRRKIGMTLVQYTDELSKRLGYH
ncbi:MAG: IclR family transcriptional regulator [Tissierellales bacterium]|nr:IclR family transcriptional regulator [Tissierellales bacterium]MBN2827291.1 IclR family transcriptional regulator [Tissierellales bacterium]